MLISAECYQIVFFKLLFMSKLQLFYYNLYILMYICVTLTNTNTDVDVTFPNKKTTSSKWSPTPSSCAHASMHVFTCVNSGKIVLVMRQHLLCSQLQQNTNQRWLWCWQSYPADSTRSSPAGVGSFKWSPRNHFYLREICHASVFSTCWERRTSKMTLSCKYQLGTIY